ncbi:tetratricopeptide repeat protein [Komarekiella sp. 'clone 1']|uniref:Tetratricopeptide repeat protein n=1 Tax=Komarekiella delphini-convector SJRDD-AB1 TaxID=2593771 RepID=A0AA40SYD4_9NOST|nr:tetratricopeptide repeat protein [Komarekiella delphini-convector]MBD6617319.1 tetratricopeptide repeat protein [Komarekiella delphini-convector SJRDD-AB1]
MPLSGVVDFVGRKEELQKLHQLLQDNKQVAIAAIAGMGGVGKTELALQYAIQHRETYNGGLCWLLPKTGDVGIQVVQFARTQLDLKPPEDFDLLAQVQYCWRRWREGDVLLVLDDVSDYEQVKPYLQSLPSRFKVLMTTRQKLGRIAQLFLDVLQPEAALELLKSLLKETPGRIEKELALANQLCEWLGYLPLGVELVGRYLARKQDLSLAEMLRRLENKRLDECSLSKSKSEADMTAQRGVLAAFELSWQELEEDDKQLGCLLSLFAAAPIAWKLVEQCLPEEDVEDLEEIRDDTLLNLHLVQRKGEGIYQLHPLLREFFQYKLTGLDKGEELKRSLCRVMVVVAKKIPDTLTLKQITAVSSVMPHLAEVAKNLIQHVSDEDLTWAFEGNAKFYNAQGLYDQAEPWVEQCLEVTKKRLGEEHPDFALSLDYLGLLYESQGRYTQAEPLLLQALQIRRHLLGEEDTNVAASLDNLAYLYDSQGRYTQAEPLLLQALQMRQRLLGEEHLHVALSLNNLAELYKSQGDYSQAEPLLLQALQMRQRLLGEENPDVAASLNNLASLYCFQGNYGEAESLYQQALEMRQRLLGEEHPDVAASLNNLAFVYYSEGNYSEAEPLYLQALKLWQHLLGEEHPLVATNRNNLAVLYSSQGRYTEAEPFYLQALELRQRLLGEEHPDVAVSLNNLAKFYYSQRSYSKAEPLYLQALDIFERRLGVDHPSTMKCCENLANLRDRLSPNPE